MAPAPESDSSDATIVAGIPAVRSFASGRYVVRRVLPEGGQKTVFLVHDMALDRDCALALIRTELLEADDLERVRREARAMARLDHPNIVAVHDIGEDEGVPYIAMTLLQGQSLEQRLRDQPRPAMAEVVDFARQIALGLAVAHAHGLVHRDIKPANIWIEARKEEGVRTKDEGGRRKDESVHSPLAGFSHPSSFPLHPSSFRVKLLDFGLARSLGDDVRLTQSGMVIGTPAYMAPEQAAGDDVDARCDLFGLGCILYRMTTGSVPFPGKDTLAIVYALANKNPPPPRRVNPAVPERLSAIVMKLLAKNPADRFASALDVVAAIDAPPASPRWRWPVTMAAAAACLAAVALTFWPTTPIENVAVNPGKNPLPNGMPAPKTDTKPGFALAFDGSGKVELGEFPMTAVGPYTLEVYATPRESKRTERQVLVGAGRFPAIEISQYRLPRPTWRFAWKFPYAIGSAAVEHGKRIHLAATYDGTEAAIYINGKIDGTHSQKTPDGPFVLFALGENFVGSIDQARISKSIRYKADFTPEKTLTADAETLALYLFRAGDGKVLRDDSGHDRHGTIVDAKWMSLPAE